MRPQVSTELERWPRVAPVPLYNSFTDVHRFVGIPDQVLNEATC